MGISILHVIHAFRPGGMENMIAQIACRLPSSEFSVAICALTGADNFRGRLPAATPVFEMKKERGLRLGCVLRLRALIKSLRPDVVHSHNWNSLIYSIPAMAGASAHAALLHGEHALLYGWERSPWRLRLRRALYNWCDVVHTVSQGQANELASFGITSGVDLRVIRNGVDIQKFSPQDKVAARAALGVPMEGRCIGMAARCVPEKRHSQLLQSFEQTAAAFPDVTLVLAGAGGEQEEIVRAQVAAHPYSRRIVWLGHRNDMPAVYNTLDLLVLSSTSEGMSNVTLEAMACGVPVLMHHACGSEELILEGVNGSAAPMADAGEIATAISRLLAVPNNLRTMGEQARAFVESEFPLSKTATGYADVYRQLAGKPET